jgi:hypothetical protein
MRTAAAEQPPNTLAAGEGLADSVSPMDARTCKVTRCVRRSRSAQPDDIQAAEHTSAAVVAGSSRRGLAMTRGGTSPSRGKKLAAAPHRLSGGARQLLA